MSDSAHIVKLPDGRNLGYAEYGDSGGNPVLYFHGHPGSRLQGHFLREPAARLGIRVIVPERPGYGESDPKPDRTFLDWPEDVAALADALELDRFAVMGASGGGPYVAVCAWQMPERVIRAAFLAAIAPSDFPGAMDGMQPRGRLLLRLARFAPWLLSLMFRGMARTARNEPEKIIRRGKKSLPKIDIAAIESGNHWSWLIADLQEANRKGVHGAVQDSILYARPWGFSLEEIRVPTFLWQGEQDRGVPPVMGRYLASALPDCQAMFVPDMGHLSLIFNYGEEALKSLAS